jgi:hypothetical protein
VKERVADPRKHLSLSKITDIDGGHMWRSGCIELLFLEPLSFVGGRFDTGDVPERRQQFYHFA